MTCKRKVAACSCGLLVVVFAGAGTALAHDEILVGRRANGQLHIHFDGPQPFRFDPSPFPGIPGWATAGIGVASVAEPEPLDDLFPASDLADLRFVLVGFDPDMVVYNGLTPMAINDVFVLGQPQFHFHPLWSRSQGTLGQVGSVQLIFRDASGTHADSDVFTLSFINAPAPASAALLGLGFVALGRRRR